MKKTPLSKLHPQPRNARKHSKKNLAAISASLERFGQQKPVVAGPDGTILAGNGTYAAAKALGWKDLLVIRSDLAGPEATAYAIADNRTAELAEWDNEILAADLAQLHTADETLGLATGYNAAEIEQLALAYNQATGADEANQTEPPPEKPKSTAGALYRLGDHRLLCGDSTDPASLARVMGKTHQAHLLVTDPPYNADYRGHRKPLEPIKNDKMPADAFAAFLRDAFTAADLALRPGAAAYVWHPQLHTQVFRAAIDALGWQHTHTLVWAKSSFVLSREHYHWQHEPCLYAYKPGGKRTWTGERKQTTILRARVPWKIAAAGPDAYAVTIDGESYLIRGKGITVAKTETTLLEYAKPQASKLHPTQKPVEILERLIANSSRRGQAVLDPFAGSGSTCIAAERLGRHAYLIELDPAYCDVIRRRWAEQARGEGCDWQKETPVIKT